TALQLHQSFFQELPLTLCFLTRQVQAGAKLTAERFELRGLGVRLGLSATAGARHALQSCPEAGTAGNVCSRRCGNVAEFARAAALTMEGARAAKIACNS